MRIIDTTLRDGLQRPGMRMDGAQRVHLAKCLAESGLVDEIEAGVPAVSEAEAALVAVMAGMGLSVPVCAWNRMREADVRRSLETGAQRVHITVPASDLHRRIKLGCGIREVVIQMERLIDLAVRAGSHVSIGLEDASRATHEDLVPLIAAGLAAGADRFRLADTVGVWRPAAVRDAVERLLHRFGGVSLAIHAHDDLGMACANTLAAAGAGVGWADVTVLGVGERAGNCALDVLVRALHPVGLSPGDTLRLDRLGRDVRLFNPAAVPEAPPPCPWHRSGRTP